MQKIALIGTFVRDRIVPLNGPEVQCLGGLYHSIAYTSLLGGDKCRVIALARVGSDYLVTVEQQLRPFDNVDFSQLVISEQPNTAVKLIYKSPTSRDEVTSPLMPPLQPDELRACRDADGTLVNLITGGDISLGALQWLSGQTEAPIYLDFHSLALDFDENGLRYYRKPADWQQWLEAADFVQMNDDEAACLCGSNSERALRRFMIACLEELGLSGMHITFGEKGVLSGAVAASGKPELRYLPAHTEKIIVRDIIGCGDAFGAAFFVYFLMTGNFWAAAAYGNKIAAHNTTFLGSITTEIFKKQIRPYAAFEK